MQETEKIANTRTKAREYVFELLFAKSFVPDEEPEDFFAHEIENNEPVLGEQSDYVRNCFFGISEKTDEIDGKISEAAVGWNLGRLSKTSLSIMRLAVFEMTSVADVPKRVALNEAVELAKKFDDDKAPAFINGVLNKIASGLPDDE